MNSDVNELARAVTKKSLHDCSVEELQQLAELYPYFGPVQLLLASKIAASPFNFDDNLTQYDEQVQKASLYFQNRVWLDHLLNGDNGNAIPVIHTGEIERPTENEIESIVVEQDPITDKKEIEDDLEESHVIVEEPATVETMEIQPEEVATSMPAEIIEQVQIEESKEEETGAADEPNVIDHTNPPIEMPPITKEFNATTPTLTFEPYHTVDYFASQGIKYREDERPKDRFASQLKSFTEWLKTLKQANVSDIVKQVDVTAEKKVEQMAEFSLAERHVITEAMAEVWKKQGNRSKAEEIYRKLSLLDPSKSSYFATKIEELKKTN